MAKGGQSPGARPLPCAPRGARGSARSGVICGAGGRHFKGLRSGGREREARAALPRGPRLLLRSGRGWRSRQGPSAKRAPGSSPGAASPAQASDPLKYRPAPCGAGRAPRGAPACSQRLPLRARQPRLCAGRLRGKRSLIRPQIPRVAGCAAPRHAATPGSGRETAGLSFCRRTVFFTRTSRRGGLRTGRHPCSRSDAIPRP